MPQVAVAVAGMVATATVESLAVYFGATALGATIASSIAGFAVSSIGNSLLSQKGKKAAPNLGAELQTGLKQVVRLSDDTLKIIYGKARIGGTLAYVESANSGPDSDGETQSGDNLFLHMVIIHAGHEVESFEELYLDDVQVTLDANGFVQEDKFNRDGKSYVRIRHHYGYTTQTADSQLVAEVTNWTTAHRLRGLAYTYVRFQWNSEIFQTGIPTFNAVIKGKKVYDPRTDTTAWSDNAALIIRDYLASRDPAGVPYGFGATANEIDDDYTIAAANIADETITKLDSSTVARYTINGVVDTSATPLDNLENLITAISGAVTYPKGKFRIHAGAYDIPEADVIDESWLAGEIVSSNRIPRQDLFNAVRGTFINPEKDWQADDFPALTSSAYEEQDNDERIFVDLELPYTIDSEAAQRIAKIRQRRGREQIAVEMLCNYRALKFTVWDNVKLTNATRGWDEKIFKIVGFAFDLRGGVNLKLREENEESYDWVASDAEAIAAAPDTNLPNPFSVAVPSGVSFNSRAIDTVGGDTLFSLVLSWLSHSDAFVSNGGFFEINFKPSDETDWRQSFTVNGNQTFADIINSSVNTQYDLRIRAVNALGSKSNWVTILGAMIGTSGGVGSTDDFGNWTSSPGSFDDFGDWTSSPGSSDDYGFYS